MKRVAWGLLGGSFDPIHFGHIHIALEMLEKHQLNRVVFCPAALAPHKEDEPPIASAEHRGEMVRRAIQPIPSFSFLDWELHRPGPSYTIDTVRALLTQHQEVELHLILGEDALCGFDHWKEAKELVSLAPPLVGSRSLFPSHVLPLEFEKVMRRGITKIPLLEISSTLVRQRLKENLYCGHLMPQPVLDYIAQHSLY